MFVQSSQGLPLTLLVAILAIGVVLVHGAEPNYPEIDDAQSESVDANVDISQESPNSNTIHVSHNIPKNSNINLKQVGQSAVEHFRKLCKGIRKIYSIAILIWHLFTNVVFWVTIVSFVS